MSRFGGIALDEEEEKKPASRFGGIPVQEDAVTPSRFGGIPVQEDAVTPSRFGGIPVQEEETADITERPDTPDIDDVSLATRAVDTQRSGLGGALGSVGRGMQGIKALNDVATRGIDAALSTVLPEKAMEFLRKPRKALEVVDLPQSVEMIGQGLEKLGGKVAPPQERETLATDIAAGVGQVATQAGLYFINPVVAAAQMVGEGAEDQDRRAAAVGQQGTPAADMAIVGGAAVTGALEKVQLTKFLSKAPYLGKLMEKLPGALKAKWASRAIDVAGAGTGEAMQEVAEGMVHDAIELAAVNPEVEFLQDWKREASAAGATGAIFRGLVSAVSGRRRMHSQMSELSPEEKEIFGDPGLLEEGSSQAESPAEPLAIEAGKVEPETIDVEAEPVTPKAIAPVEPIEPDTIEDPRTTPPVESEPVEADPDARTGDLPGEEPIKEIVVKVKKGKGIGFAMGLRADGEEDILNHIDAAGGLRSIKTYSNTEGKGEWDGYDEVFRNGQFSTLLTKDTGGNGPAELMDHLNQEHGYGFTTPSQMYNAIAKAPQQRQFVADQEKRYAQNEKFVDGIYSNSRARNRKKAVDQPISSNTLNKGDTFKISGSLVTVKDISPDDYSLTVDGGERYGFQRIESGEGLWIDEGSLTRAPAEKIAEGDPFRESLTKLANAKPEQVKARRQWINTQTEKWTAHAEKLAPGVMNDYAVKVGSLLDLGKLTPIDADRNPANIEAAHLASRKMIFLVDSLVNRPTDNLTLLTLQHELGHAHWDTLSRAKKEKLQALHKEEIKSRTGPLFKNKAMRKGVAKGVEADIREWYAERIAWNNHEYGKRRTGIGVKPVKDGVLGQAAQNLRIWLRKALDFAKDRLGLTGDIDAAYRRFLDRGGEMSQETAKPDATPATQEFAVSFAERELGTAQEGVTQMEREIRFKTIRNRLKGSKVGRLGKKYFTSAGHLPKQAFEALRAKNHRLNAGMKIVEDTISDLNAVVIDKFGGWKAMGSQTELALNNHLAGGSRFEGDPQVTAVLDRMRAQIDGLSRRLINEGVVDGKLLGKIEGNLGFYLNRSYRKYDDKAWGAKVMQAKPGTELAKIRSQATEFIHNQMRDDMVKDAADKEFRQTYPEAKRIYRSKDAYKKIYERLHDSADIQPEPKHVENKIATLLRPDVTPGVYLGVDAAAAKKLGIFKKRKSIPPEIRRLWGEHTDARINYANSVMKTLQVLSAQRALNDIKDAGKGVFLFDNDHEVDGGGARIAAEGNEALAPLDGLWTTPDIRDALVESAAGPASGTFLSAWYRVNGYVKMSKTVLSPVSQVRNHLANYGFMLANGHFHFSKFGKSFGVLAKEFTGTMDNDARRAYIYRLTRLGVIGESVHANELKEAMNAAKWHNKGDLTLVKFSESIAIKAAKAGPRKAAQLYQLNDDFFKIYAFENERARLAWAKPELDNQALDVEAAARVRDTMPNYSMIPKAFEKVRRGGLTGSFVSFSVESMRVAWKIPNLAIQDIRSGNPRLAKSGALRLLGYAAAMSAPHALQWVSQAAVGVSDDEDKKIRTFQPDYARNSNVYYRGKDGAGSYRMVDMSYMDVFNWGKRILNAATYNEDPWPLAKEMFRETYSPVFGEGLVSKAILDIGRNTKSNGSEVVPAAASFPEKLMAWGSYIGELVEPGAVTTGRRIKRGADGYVTPTGREYVLEDELKAAITGMRTQSVDIGQSLEYKAGHYAAMKRSAAGMFNKVANRKNTPEIEDVCGAKKSANEARQRHWEIMRQNVLDAQALGVPPEKIIASLKAGGMGQMDILSLIAGLYTPYVPAKVYNIDLK